mmetsp:Transcript_20232/g.58653  ORF Transcript_20232/g.58653 Transcript_20232/m.58653 type:complete len:314 (+) Transcript_20232:335-1276(+)
MLSPIVAQVTGIAVLPSKRFRAPVVAGSVLRRLLQQPLQHRIEPVIHLLQRQVVRATPERALGADGGVVEGPEHERYEERQGGGLRRGHPQGAKRRQRHHAIERQHDPCQLRKVEWETHRRDFVRVDHVHEADGELLEDAGQDRRRDVNDAAAVLLDNEPLHPLQHDVLPRRRAVYVLDALGANLPHIQVGKALPVELGDVTHRVAHQQAHEPRQHELEGPHLVLAVRRGTAKGDQVAATIQPHTARTLHKCDTLPVPAVGQLRAEGRQKPQSHREQRPPDLFVVRHTAKVHGDMRHLLVLVKHTMVHHSEDA